MMMLLSLKIFSAGWPDAQFSIMTENTAAVIRSMRLHDIGNCLLLSDAEGWNQTEKDWKRLVANPQNTCLVASDETRIIGTATAMNYSNVVSWIGMVLVEKSYRGRGISKILLSDLLNQLESFKSIKLDATPAGQPVYKKFGFQDECIIYRMTNPALENFRPDKNEITPEPILFQNIPEVTALDESIFGAERSYLLKSLIYDYPDKAWLIKGNGYITAFALSRQGRDFQHIGPVFASNLKDAKVLISHAMLRLIGQAVSMDVPEDKIELIQWLNSFGFTSQRYFVRMYRQSNPCPGKTENQFLICGPEFG
jgi:ribosomal protein S18 acetylase RimI-like enzyme